jgi:hypothetical protein
MHGSLSTAARNLIVTALGALGPADTLGQARAATYLLASSSQYQVER